MSIRILFVSHSFPPAGRPLSNIGGMQRVATDLHTALSAHPGVELHSLVLEASWRSTHPRIPWFLLRLLRRIPRIAEQERIDVVLFSSMVTAAVALPLRRTRLRGVGMTAIAHGLDITMPNAFYQHLLPFVLRSLDAVFPVSRATASECTARGIPAERVHVVPNGVNLDHFPPPTDRAALRDEVVHLLQESSPPLPSDPLLLLGVGRHVERKGFAWFVDQVMPLLTPDFVFLLVGNGPQTSAIRKAVCRNGLQSRVRMLGRVPDELLMKLYGGADLFVMPNTPVSGDMEGFGVVMLEAGISGTPIIAADLEGIRDVVHQGANGILVPSGDADAFAREILHFRQDRAALAAAAVRAASHTARHYAWPTVAERYIAGLQSVVAQRRSERAVHPALL